MIERWSTVRMTRSGDDPMAPGARWTAAEVIDEVAVERPLQIDVTWSRRGRRVRRPVAVTMRTPGQDRDLARGFLLSEGLIDRLDDIERFEDGPDPNDDQDEEGGEAIGETLNVVFRDGVVVELCDTHRRGPMTSACGVCGKVSSQQLRVRPRRQPSPITVAAADLAACSERLRSAQPTFARTGGLHGCGWFNAAGQLLGAAEDVGRHNALDKLIGRLEARACRLDHGVLGLSGRVSYELMQKSIAAGIPIIVAVGAPSSFAVAMARHADRTLIGFSSDRRMNVYTGAERISPS